MPRKAPATPFYAPQARPATARQGEVLAAVVALSEELGRGPNTLELAERLGLTRSGMRSVLRQMEGKGLLRDVPKVVRSGRWEVT